jgi:hypothetical protein
MRSAGCVVLCVVVAQVGGNPKGPPLRACSNMTPGKAHQPNTLTDEEKDNPPFQVESKHNKVRESNTLSLSKTPILLF